MTSTSEKRGPTRRFGFRAGVVAFVTAALVTQGAFFASAKDLDEYATWDDVVDAQGDVDEQNRLIEEINGQISQLKTQVAEAEQVAEQKGEAYSQASEATTEQTGVVYSLQQQADEADEAAIAAEQEAGAVAASMSNRVNVDPTIQLLTEPDSADGFLMGMSTLSKVGTHNGGVYENAVSARNNAEQLGEQAQSALDELEVLEAAAEAAYNEAVAAQQDLQTKRDEAINQGAELEAMLVPLMEHRDVVEADYQEGERLRELERQRIERERAEAAAAAQAAAEAAAREQQTNSGGGGGGGGGGSAPSTNTGGGGGGGGGGSTASGWHAPLPGAWVTSPFGMRLHPVYGYYRMHNGIDLVSGGGCWAPIHAVTSGTVTFAGWFGGSGYMVSVQASDGTTFNSAHMPEGGMNVYVGQSVSAGDVIGYVGTTGASTGCHLHFEVVQGGYVDPRAYLANRGIYY
ncbi:M23 family metallopeptidase [Gulosibacter sp. 10]|uniref:M23 family metallopeptidase n=1 Tax=Gulosibacter sp. 10 TaxID=1255570 RepID=UPI000B3556A3|nr:M23 family metallopeptidase [Gulosibacter sp. 10]